MQAIFVIAWGAVGAALGSFLNAMVWRLRSGTSIVHGRSQCPVCGHVLLWYDLVPLVSFFLLRGRCRHCKKKISWRYPAVEVWMGVLFAGIASLHATERITDIAGFLLFCFVVWILTIIFVYDFLYQEIPDSITLPAIAVLMLFFIFEYSADALANRAIGMMVGGGFFLLQYLVSRGKWIGGGDIRLGVLMGILLGWPNILVAFFLSYVSGAIIGGLLLLTKKKTMKSELPFGIFLAPSTLTAMVWGHEMVRWYVHFLY